MSTRRIGRVLEHIRKCARIAPGSEPTDGQLLEQVVHGEREEASTALALKTSQ
jgi:hypothetical protein